MPTSEWPERALKLRIHWVVDPEKDCCLKPQDGPVELRLRMNNFPDEPMYSLLFPGGHVELEDLPQEWTRTDDLQWPPAAAPKDAGKTWWNS